MEIVGKVEKAVERILSKIVGTELSAQELEQVSGGSKDCSSGGGTSQSTPDGCDE